MTDPCFDKSPHFPIVDSMVFLNHAAVAPLSPPAAEALRDYADQAASQAYVGSGWYRAIERLREVAATLIGARGQHEIAFIPNTSTGLSLVAKGFPFRQGDEVVITSVEYPANRYPWQDLARFGVKLIEVPQQRDGRVDVDDVIDAITDRTKIVAVSHVQYATGYRIDLRAISDVVHQARGYLCVDAIQSVGAIPMDVQAMGIDFLSADGHKWMLGPEGAGLFYCHQDLAEMLHPNIVGWLNMRDAHNYGQYDFTFERNARRFEPGTHNIPGLLALGASLQMLLDIGIDNVWQRIEQLTSHLCDGLTSLGHPIISPREPHERSGIVTFTPSPRSETSHAKNSSVDQIAASLAQQNIIIATREGRLRVSPHFYNTIDQIDQLLNAL